MCGPGAGQTARAKSNLTINRAFLTLSDEREH